MKRASKLRVWVSNTPATIARLLAQFPTEAQAQKFADRVRKNNPKWKVEVNDE